MSETPPRRRSSCAGTVVLLVLILAGLAAFIFWRVETMPGRMARRVQEIFGEVAHLTPKVTINDRVVVEQATSMLELAVVSRDVQVEHEVEHEWLGSTKKLRLRGVYKVRAGFDLTKLFEVQVEGRHVQVDLPPPKILSVDQLDAEVTSFENGLWNKVQPTEVAVELRQLPGEAMKKAIQAGMTREALESIRRQLEEKFGSGWKVEVRVRPSAAQARD